MRKKAKSWIIIVPVGIIILVFVFFYGFSDVRKKGKETVIASVGNRKISMTEYNNACKNMIQFYRNVYKNELSEDMIKNMGIKQKVLEDLIDRELLLQEAQRLEVRITPDQVKNTIKNTPTFQENGAFSQRLYEKVLSYYGITALDYERDREKELIIKTLEEMIKGPVKVSEKELRDIYSLQNEKVKIEYICFDPRKIEQKPAVSEEDLLAYYEKNKEDFRVPEMVKVKYISFVPKDFEKRVNITKEEIEEYYQTDPEQFFEPHQVKARHILLKLEKDISQEKEEKVRNKAKDILEKLKRGESFEKLAREFSKDTATAEKGGDLGYFKKGQMVKPLEETAFSLKPGETSSPIKTKYGYHIIRVEDIKQARTKPLEEAQEVIENDLKKEKAQELVRKEARRAFNRLFKSRNLAEYAKKNDLKLSETNYFSYGKSLEDMPGKELFSREAFTLSQGELAPAFAIGQKYILLKLEEKKESQVPPLERVKEAIKTEVEKEKKKEIAKQRAEKALSLLMEGKQLWEDLEKKPDLEIKEAEVTRTGKHISGIGNAEELIAAAFELEKEKKLAASVFQTDPGSVLVRLKEKIVPENSVFEKQKEDIKKTTLQKKQMEVFDRFMQEIKSRSDYWVNRKLLPSV
jgi:peptidyl-prolyl cis-trans isomerase D